MYSPCGQQLERRLTRSLAMSMFECLEQLHKIGAVHRDLSPQNFVTFENRLILIDFGTVLFLNKLKFSYDYEGTIEFAARDILDHLIDESKR